MSVGSTELSRTAAIGDELRLGGYALAGALVYHAVDAADAEAALQALPPDVEVLVLTEDAHEALARRLPEERPGLVWAVVPS